ncbi:NifB/NifX family molybdenum-iron cluster-binding protein [Melioribacter sp. OK-6-Me]|uniref:NifB/NifX family molybdenum-iron cluster-binding protein n=1 Tax=unclassified Melioribacter TaxID=2627329 RepID=UPI003ED9F2D3
MKIAVALEKPEKTSQLSEVFGRSNFFLIFNTEGESEKIINNPYAKELGGAGIQAARTLIENNINIVITRNIGTNPFRFLASAGIKVYLCQEGTAADAIQLYNEGKLTAAVSIDYCYTRGKKRKRYGKNCHGNKLFKNKRGDL